MVSAALDYSGVHPPKVLLVCGGRCLTARTFDYCAPAFMTLMVDDLRLFELGEHAKFVILDVIERSWAEFSNRNGIRQDMDWDEHAKFVVLDVK